MILDTVFLNGWYSKSIQNDIVGHCMILWNGKTNGWYCKFPFWKTLNEHIGFTVISYSSASIFYFVDHQFVRNQATNAQWRTPTLDGALQRSERIITAPCIYVSSVWVRHQASLGVRHRRRCCCCCCRRLCRRWNRRQLSHSHCHVVKRHERHVYLWQ